MSSNNNKSDLISLPISGVVLAGGRSRRFGQDKASYIYNGKRMLDWSLASLSKTQEQLIIANQPYTTDVPIYTDIRTNCSDSGCGPMGGLYTALTHAKYDWVALAACDMPNLTPSYWQALYKQVDLLNAKHAVVIQSDDNRLQTLAALYHKALLPIIETHLDNNKLALQSLSEYFNITKIDNLEYDSKNPKHLFLNFNYLRDIK